jgi:predicted PurR-regulated permease PerM
MLSIKTMFTSLIMFALVSSVSFAQQTAQQQQQRMQQQMQQMQEMTKTMNKLMERTHSMNQEMNKQMQQAKNEQMRNQYRMMNRMSEQMGMTLGSMKNAAERCEMMLQNKDMMQDRIMRRETDRLREHIHKMTGDMEEAVATMERLMERLHENRPTSSL